MHYAPRVRQLAGVDIMPPPARTLARGLLFLQPTDLRTMLDHNKPLASLEIDARVQGDE